MAVASLILSSIGYNVFDAEASYPIAIKHIAYSSMGFDLRSAATLASSLNFGLGVMAALGLGFDTTNPAASYTGVIENMVLTGILHHHVPHLSLATLFSLYISLFL